VKKKIKEIEAYEKNLVSWCEFPYKGNRHWVSVEQLEKFVEFVLAENEDKNEILS